MVTVGVFAGSVGEPEGSRYGGRLPVFESQNERQSRKPYVVFSPQRNLSFFKLRLQEFLVWTKMEVRPLRFL
jgi:hypothetical protein